MPILQATDSVTGLVGVFPNLVFINTNDTPATVLNVGYLNTAVQENLLQVNNGDMALIATVTAGVISVNWLQVKVTGTPGNFNYSLGAPALLAALALGNFQAGEDGVAGGYISYPLVPASGFLELFATANAGAFNTLITNAPLTQTTTFTIPNPGVAATNFVLTNSLATQMIASGSLAVTNGSLYAGQNGVNGTFVSYPATAANGTLIVSASNSPGGFNSTITNSALSQNTTYSLPDTLTPAANFVVRSTPLVGNNLVRAAGASGDVADSGILASNVQLRSQIHAQQTGNIGGAGAGPLNIIDASVTAASVIVASVRSSTNPVSVIAVVPGAGSFTVTVSANPGANLTINYIVFVAAQ